MDFYIVLGLDRDATVADVKGYRRLARRFHPDVNPGDQRCGRALPGDRGGLRHPRAMPIGADATTSWVRGAGGRKSAASGFEGFDFSAAVYADRQSTFGDLFAEVFGADDARRGPGAGRRPARDAALSFAQAMQGGEHRVVVLTRQATCGAVPGRGGPRWRPPNVRRATASAPCGRPAATWSSRGPAVGAAGSGVLSQQGCTAAAGSAGGAQRRRDGDGAGRHPRRGAASRGRRGQRRAAGGPPATSM